MNILSLKEKYFFNNNLITNKKIVWGLCVTYNTCLMLLKFEIQAMIKKTVASSLTFLNPAKKSKIQGILYYILKNFLFINKNYEIVRKKLNSWQV